MSRRREVRTRRRRRSTSRSRIWKRHSNARRSWDACNRSPSTTRPAAESWSGRGASDRSTPWIRGEIRSASWKRERSTPDDRKCWCRRAAAPALTLRLQYRGERVEALGPERAHAIGLGFRGELAMLERNLTLRDALSHEANVDR